MKWLALLLQVLVEVSEVDLSCGEFPLRSLGSKPQVRLPGLSTKPGKRHPHNIFLWKATRFLFTRERRESARDTGTFLNGQCTRFRLLQFTLGSCRGKMEWSRVMWGESAVCVSSRELKGQPPRSCAESFYCIANTIFLGWSTPLCVVSVQGKVIALLWTPSFPPLWSFHPAEEYS